VVVRHAFCGVCVVHVARCDGLVILLCRLHLRAGNLEMLVLKNKMDERIGSEAAEGMVPWIDAFLDGRSGKSPRMRQGSWFQSLHCFPARTAWHTDELNRCRGLYLLDFAGIVDLCDLGCNLYPAPLATVRLAANSRLRNLYLSFFFANLLFHTHGL